MSEQDSLFQQAVELHLTCDVGNRSRTRTTFILFEGACSPMSTSMIAGRRGRERLSIEHLGIGKAYYNSTTASQFAKLVLLYR